MAEGEKKNYSVKAAGSWTIIQAVSAAVACQELADRLGVGNKPWLVKGITATEATPDELARYIEMVDVGPRKRDGRNVIQERFGE